MVVLEKIPKTLLDKYATTIKLIEEGNYRLDSLRGDIHSEIASRILLNLRKDKREEVEKQLEDELNKFLASELRSDKI